MLGSPEITKLLKAWGAGDAAALNRLTPAVYQELRRRARGYMRHQAPGNTLQTTALVNEVYLHLVDAAGVKLAGPRAFSSPSAPGLCGEFWWIRRAPAARPSAA